MNRKNLELLQLLAIPVMALVCGLVGLVLALLTQTFADQSIGVVGFALPAVVGALTGTVFTSMRLGDGTGCL